MDGTVTVNKALQRSRGEAGLGFRDGDLARLHQRGAAKALLPRTHSSVHEAVLVNTAGGITGGVHQNGLMHAAVGLSLIHI